jgi:hypothetical protein
VPHNNSRTKARADTQAGTETNVQTARPFNFTLAWYFVVAGLFLVAAIYNLFVGNFAEACGGFVIFGVFKGAFSFHRYDSARSDRLVEFLLVNKEKLAEGRLLYGREHLSLSNELVQYEATIGLLVGRLRLVSGYHLKSDPLRHAYCAVYCLISLLVGWLELPLGPIVMVRTIFGNLTGGRKIRLGGLFEAS